MPKVAGTPHGRPRGTTGPQTSNTKQGDASAALSHQKTHSMLTSPSSPDHMSWDRIAVRMKSIQPP